MSVTLPIYLDNNATTRTDPRVVDVIIPFFSNAYGNAASKSHPFGWAAEEAVDKARAQVASLIGADPREIVFTSGATESNNLAIKGIAEMYAEKGDHIITVVTEHKAVLDTCMHLESTGKSVTYLEVDDNGLINLDDLKTAITDKTILISVMAANNEIGVLQPIAEIGAICKERGIIFHTDATQIVGKIPFDVEALGIDLASFTAHKMYGPKGIGALYVRRRSPRVRLSAQIDGGGHERGFRSGTLNVTGIVGFAFAKSLKISFGFVEGESLLMGLCDVALSSGSACTSASLEPSYVLKALGVGDELAHSSLRFGLGRFTKPEEVEWVTEKVIAEVARLREMSPLWELHLEGVDLSTVQWQPH